MGSAQLRRTQSGFTLIELVVVIVILGILAATALPKFIDISADARKSAVAGIYGGFSSGIAMARAKWMVDGASKGPSCNGTIPDSCDGNSATSTIEGATIAFNYLGYPIGQGTKTVNNGMLTMAPDLCMEVWKGILGGNGPSIATTGTVGIDWVAAGTANRCTYTYHGGTVAAASPGRSFTYDTDTGALALTNP